MRRPTRTHRLSIVAIEWFAVFLVVAVAGIRSFWICDALGNGNDRAIFLEGGYLVFIHSSGNATFLPPSGYLSGPIDDEFPFPRSFLGFAVKRESATLLFGKAIATEFSLRAPLWFPLLLLLINPVRWLIARPVRGPAFPVVTDAKNE